MQTVAFEMSSSHIDHIVYTIIRLIPGTHLLWVRRASYIVAKHGAETDHCFSFMDLCLHWSLNHLLIVPLRIDYTVYPGQTP